MTAKTKLHCVLGESLDGIYLCNSDGQPVAKVLSEHTESFGDELCLRFNSHAALVGALAEVLDMIQDSGNDLRLSQCYKDARVALEGAGKVEVL